MRHHFARADHGDDLIYVFGIPFDPDHKLPHGRFFSEEEKELSKRMMTGMNLFISLIFIINYIFSSMGKFRTLWKSWMGSGMNLQKNNA